MGYLRCEALRKSFGGVDALVDVSLEFPSSSCTAIVGPNGAGKTTLLNVLTGFLKPDGGRCFVGKYETTSLPAYRIASFGIARTFQDLRLIFHLSVLDNVLLARPSPRGESLLGALFGFGVAAENSHNRVEVDRLLTLVGLAGISLAAAGELSYGQQKLLSLACCLATEANIFLLDEPVAGVHPEMASRILRLLRELCEGGKTIVFIEHDITAVRQVADHLIVMDEGKIIAHGPPGEVLEQPAIMEAYLG